MEVKKERSTLLAYLAVLIAVLGLSGSGPLGKLAVKDGIDPSVLSLYRIVISQLIIIPMIIFNRGRKEEIKTIFKFDRKFIILSLLSGLFLAIHYISWYASVNLTTVYRATVISDIAPVFAMFFTWIFLREKPKWRQMVAMSVSIFGVIMISSKGNDIGGSLIGDIYALFAGIGWAAYFVFGQKIRSSLTVWVYTLIVNLFCIIFLLSYILITGKAFVISQTILLVSLFIALFGTIVGHTLLNWALPVTGATFVSLACLGETFVITIIAWILFSEFPTALTLISGIISIIGMAIFALWKEKQVKIN